MSFREICFNGLVIDVQIISYNYEYPSMDSEGGHYLDFEVIGFYVDCGETLQEFLEEEGILEEDLKDILNVDNSELFTAVLENYCD